MPIQVHVLGYEDRKNSFLFERYINYRVKDVIRRYSSGRPVLIFCNSRKETKLLAKLLANEMQQELLQPEAITTELRQASNRFSGTIMFHYN